MSDFRKSTDTELVRACAAGDQDAWAALVRRYERLVYSIPVRYGMHQSECDDVFQSTWLILLRQLRTIKDPDRIGAWLVTTAKRECWARRRGADHKRSFSTDPDEIPEQTPPGEQSPELLLERFQLAERLRDGLDQLEVRCRRLLTLLYLEPDAPSYAEISQQLDMPVGAVGPTRARCLQKLKSILE